MSKIDIQLSGVAAELVLGSYTPDDTTIFHNWEDFYQFNDLIHHSRLLTEHIAEIQIKQDDALIFTGKIPTVHLQAQTSITPELEHQALYLRTECAEQAVYHCVFETDNFDKTKLIFETQDYDLLFKVGKSFLSKVLYDGKELPLEWISGKPIGNISLLCRCENGFLKPIYDAVQKIAAT